MFSNFYKNSFEYTYWMGIGYQYICITIPIRVLIAKNLQRVVFERCALTTRGGSMYEYRGTGPLTVMRVSMTAPSFRSPGAPVTHHPAPPSQPGQRSSSTRNAAIRSAIWSSFVSSFIRIAFPRFLLIPNMKKG